MVHIITELSTSSLERLVSSLEARLIAGTATAREVESYMLMEMELAERQLGAADVATDPRD